VVYDQSSVEFLLSAAWSMPLVVGGAGAGLMGESEKGPEAPLRFAWFSKGLCGGLSFPILPGLAMV
jgi:hypothetical protein